MRHWTILFQKVNLFALLVLFCIASRALAAPPVPVAPQPTWAVSIPVNLAAEPRLESISSGVHYLLVDSQVRVDDTNPSEYFYHYAEKVLNQTGVEKSSQITIDFDPSYESLTLHKMVIWRDSRAIDKLDTARMSLIHREEELDNLLYNGHQTLHAILDDVRTGDIIEYSFTRAGDNPIYDNIFAYSHSLNWSVPLHHLAVTVHWQKQAPLYHQIVNSDIPLQTENAPQGVRYRLERFDVEAVVEEESLPRWFQPYSKLYFSEAKNWRQIANWARLLMESSKDSGPDVKKLAEGIRAQHRDPAEQIFAALQYVQEEIRYFGVEIGENSHRPEKASTTLNRRYGDCKDKTVLLLSILSELNVEAYAALVNTRRKQTINDIIPSAQLFDHMITSVVHNGETYWLDPTRQYQRGGLRAIHQADFGYALVLSPRAESLTAMTSKQAPLGRTVNDVFDLSADKETPVPYTVSTASIGLDAENIRHRRASSSANAIRDDYLSFYKDYYPHIESAGAVTFDDNPERNEMLVTERYAVNDLWELDEDDGKYYASFYSNAISTYLKAPKEKKRSTPLSLAHPVNVRQIIELNLDNQEWEFDDEEFSENNEFFVFSNSVRFDKANKRLTLEYTYHTKTDAVPAPQLPDYLAALERSNKHLNYSIFSSFEPPASADNPEEETNYLFWIYGVLALLSLIAILLWRIDSARHRFNGKMLYYPVAPAKFIALWVLTFGIYGIYWFYRNWRYVRHRDQSHIMPFARGLFYPLWYYPLFKELQEENIRQGRGPILMPVIGVILAVAFFLLNAVAGFVDYEVIFSCAASILLLPIVNSINNISANKAAYQHNSRWRIHHYLLTLLTVPLLAITLGSETGLRPSDRVVSGSKLFSHDVKFLQRKGVISPNENIVYFYSDGFLSNREDGNGYTDSHIFSYWQDDSGFHLESAAYHEIEDIQTTWGGLTDNTVIKIIRPDESWFILYASTTKKKDKVFVEGLMSRWKAQTRKTEAERATAI